MLFKHRAYMKLGDTFGSPETNHTEVPRFYVISARKGIAPLGPKVTSTRLILIFRGLCGVGFMATYYYSLAVLPMSDAVVLTYTSPVLTALAASLVLGETWHSLDFLGSALCLTGWGWLLGFLISV